MEGFEIINKYNERCMAWRQECAKLLAEWSNSGDDSDKRFEKETWTIAGFLCVSDNKVLGLLHAVATADIEHVVLALRWLRQRKQAPSKPHCNFCTRLAEKGEHVEGCIGSNDTPCKNSFYMGRDKPSVPCKVKGPHTTCAFAIEVPNI